MRRRPIHQAASEQRPVIAPQDHAEAAEILKKIDDQQREGNVKGRQRKNAGHNRAEGKGDKPPAQISHQRERVPLHRFAVISFAKGYLRPR